MIDVRRYAVEIAPAAGGLRTARLSNLGAAYHTRFARTGRTADLEMAVEVGRFAALVSAAQDAEHAAVLSNLATALYPMWQLTPKPAILVELVKQWRAAVAATPRNDPRRAERVIGLADALLARFDGDRDVATVDEAVTWYRQAVGDTRVGQPVRATALARLDHALRVRHARTGSAADRGERALLGALLAAPDATPAPHHDPRSGVEPRTARPHGPGRGIVVGISITETDNGYSFGGSSARIRTVALYWDTVVLVSGNGVGNRPDPRLRIVAGFDELVPALERAGIVEPLHRDMYHPAWNPAGPVIDHSRVLGVPMGEYVKLTGDLLYQTAVELNTSDPGTWSTGCPLNSPTMRTEPDDAMRSALLLTITLPAPPEDAPAERIIEFRQRHAEPVAALWAAIRGLATASAATVDALLDELRSRLAEAGQLVDATFGASVRQRMHVVLHEPDEQADLPAGADDDGPRLSRVRVSSRLLLAGRVPDFAYLFE